MADSHGAVEHGRSQAADMAAMHIRKNTVAGYKRKLLLMGTWLATYAQHPVDDNGFPDLPVSNEHVVAFFGTLVRKQSQDPGEPSHPSGLGPSGTCEYYST